METPIFYGGVEVENICVGSNVRMSAEAILDDVPGCLKHGPGIVRRIWKNYIDVMVGGVSDSVTTYHQDYVIHV